MTRIAYLITSYKLPHQVLRLASVLRAGSSTALIVIHHDDRRCSLDRPALDTLGVTLIEPPAAVEWGETSQLMLHLRGLFWLLARTDFDWVTLLSGQDYPLRPVADIERSLAEASVDGFIEARPCHRPSLRHPPDEFAARYFYRWARVPAGVDGPLTHLIARRTGLVCLRTMPTGRRLGVPSVRTPFGAEFICHRGSDWFTLSRPAVAAVNRFCQKRPEVLRYYARTLVPSESFIHTVLANDDSLRLSSDYSRYTIWDTPGLSSPRILGHDDLELLLGSGANFARKFDETVDSGVLDEIDRRVHAGQRFSAT